MTNKKTSTTQVQTKPQKKEKVEYAGTMESLVSVLNIIVGGVEMSDESIFAGIHKAGKEYKVETGNIVAGCGGVAITDVMNRIVEAYNG